jgi:hypothetical protein
MKNNASPKLDASWWHDHAPEGLSGSNALVKALRTYTKASETHRDAPTDKTQRAVLDSIETIEESANDLAHEVGTLLKRGSRGRRSDVDPDDLANTAQALKKLSKLIAAGRASAVKAGHGADEADHDSILEDADAYGDYLRAHLLRLKIVPLNFAFVPGRSPEESRFLFHRIKGGKKLMLSLKKATGIKRATWGTAKADPERKGTMVLEIGGKQLPAMKMRITKLLKAFKPLPYGKAVIAVGGNEVEDIAENE